MSKTYEQQIQLGSYCKTGKNEPKTSIQEHTYQYRRLVRNIFHNSLGGAFPIAKHLLGTDKFATLVDHFFENHQCQSPQVWKMPLEFVNYYEDHSHTIIEEYPLLNQLFMFEWLEIEVYTMEDEVFPDFKKESTSLDDTFVPNTELRIQVLNYPFHKKRVKEISEADKGQYIVTIHRDYHTKKAMFNDISYPFAEMLLAINENPLKKSDLLNMISKHEPDLVKQEEAIQIFIDYMMKQNLILGYSIT